jgi:hypothetical protein
VHVIALVLQFDSLRSLGGVACMTLIKVKEPWRAGEVGGSPHVVERVTQIRAGETDVLMSSTPT